MALPVRRCDRIANIRERLPRLVQNSTAFQTLLHRIVFFRPAAELGHQETTKTCPLRRQLFSKAAIPTLGTAVFGATDCQGQPKTVTQFRAPFG
jgi:hypothetical protein